MCVKTETKRKFRFTLLTYICFSCNLRFIYRVCDSYRERNWKWSPFVCFNYRVYCISWKLMTSIFYWNNCSLVINNKVIKVYSKHLASPFLITLRVKQYCILYCIFLVKYNLRIENQMHVGYKKKTPKQKNIQNKP